MSLRLQLASCWMPRFMKVREIERIRSSTFAALDKLLEEHVPGGLMNEGDPRSRRLEDRRAAMAQGHRRRVEALIRGVGRENAIPLGRTALFSVGEAMGRNARRRLGVGETRRELLQAVGVMYNILGIEFTVSTGPGGDRLVVSRCALSPHYSKDVCTVLSAVDEGAVSGLNPGAKMLFREHLTDGAPQCVASISIEEA
ncbi:MAG: hypothetical protein A4E31_00061 [Methanomassiliicoccales archaeon PtaU1.Bin030]|nr:MAG: hypothetical protein A4E31_00061 [Methanomassiliicoccales archaeon PtaU1.Bin030]